MATSTAYIEYEDLTAFYDQNTVNDLLHDDGNEYKGDPESDPKFLAIAEAASGQVEAACGVSELYGPEDLAALTGNTLGLLKQLVAALCMVGLVRRRPEKFGSEYWQAVRKETEEYLDRLRKGERLFDDAHKRQAGFPTVSGPTAVRYAELNTFPSRVRNFFPNVEQRLPLGR